VVRVVSVQSFDPTRAAPKESSSFTISPTNGRLKESIGGSKKLTRSVDRSVDLSGEQGIELRP
jgi:hypothetical protein